MIIDKSILFEDFTIYIDAISIDGTEIESIISKVSEYKVPKYLDVDFNSLKFKDLIDLQSKIIDFESLIFVSFKTLHNLDADKVLKMPAVEVLKFALFVKSELERITDLFKRIEYKPTSDEIKAGIKNISHGFFGSIDWYARRMGITDHDEVVNRSWAIVYNCMKIDFENNSYERRYRELMNKKNLNK